MGDAGGAFDDDLERDLLGAALGGLDRGDQRVHGVDVFGTADFRDHDLVDPLGALFEQFDDIAIPVGGVERIDPHREIFVTPVDLMRGLNDVAARLRLVGGGHRVLEIEVDHIRRRCCHFREQLGVRAGAKELAAVRAGGGGRLDAEAHRWAFRNDVSRLVVAGIYCCVLHFKHPFAGAESVRRFDLGCAIHSASAQCFEEACKLLSN